MKMRRRLQEITPDLTEASDGWTCLRFSFLRPISSLYTQRLHNFSKKPHRWINMKVDSHQHGCQEMWPILSFQVKLNFKMYLRMFFILYYCPLAYALYLSFISSYLRLRFPVRRNDAIEGERRCLLLHVWSFVSIPLWFIYQSFNVSVCLSVMPFCLFASLFLCVLSVCLSCVCLSELPIWLSISLCLYSEFVS